MYSESTFRACSMSGKAFVLLSALHVCATVAPVSSQQIPAYDTLTLAQMWKRSSCCSVNNLASPSPNCDQCVFTDSASDWTIHGLWPTDSTRKSKVEFCPNPVKGIAFRNYPGNLLASMNKFWTNNRHEASNEQFWWYQWKKHGTCAIEIPATSDDRKYFSRTVDLYDDNQVGKILNDQGIVPSREYGVDDVYKALQKKLRNYKPVVRCIKNGGISYLSEVYLCFTKDFSLKNCNSRTNCDKNVYYP